MDEAKLDWTLGGAAIVVHECGSCRHVWYFRRDLCPGCGAGNPVVRNTAGAGTVAALTVVHRGPGAEWRAITPYTIVLVDLDEGIRIMAHADGALAIGDSVTVVGEERMGRILPVAREQSSEIQV